MDFQESDLDDGAASLPDDEPGSWVEDAGTEIPFSLQQGATRTACEVLGSLGNSPCLIKPCCFVRFRASLGFGLQSDIDHDVGDRALRYVGQA